MSTQINKAFLIFAVAVLAVSYCAGYWHAKKSGDLEFANYKLELAEKFNQDLEKEKKEYEEREKNLIAAFERDNLSRVDRMRQLEQKLRERADCSKVTSERARAFELAIEGEQLLFEARRIIEAMKR